MPAEVMLETTAPKMNQKTHLSIIISHQHHLMPLQKSYLDLQDTLHPQKVLKGYMLKKTPLGCPSRS